jgi:hypothetical protein
LLSKTAFLVRVFCAQKLHEFPLCCSGDISPFQHTSVVGNLGRTYRLSPHPLPAPTFAFSRARVRKDNTISFVLALCQDNALNPLR